jgi:hypothetical protein
MIVCSYGAKKLDFDDFLEFDKKINERVQGFLQFMYSKSTLRVILVYFLANVRSRLVALNFQLKQKKNTNSSLVKLVKKTLSLLTLSIPSIEYLTAFAISYSYVVRRFYK